ncbi:MAG TPA: hypothetical protein VMF04_04575 [Thermoplasmata archaeon]|nr:hypothetical protein [Thermoplasmata archaeon]
MRIALLTVVVVVIVVLALLFAGILPGLGGGPSSGKGVSYVTARSAADSAAARVGGAPWYPVAISALDSTSAFAGVYAEPTCYCGINITTTLNSTNLEVPADRNSLSSGLSPWWTFLYSNGTTNHDDEAVILVVVVLNGTAVPIETETSSGFQGVPRALPSAGLLDSPAIMSAAVASNSSFFNAHPSLNATLTFNNATAEFGGEFWFAYFTTCNLAPMEYNSTSVAYPGFQYSVGISATTGLNIASQGLVSDEQCHRNA